MQNSLSNCFYLKNHNIKPFLQTQKKIDQNVPNHYFDLPLTKWNLLLENDPCTYYGTGPNEFQNLDVYVLQIGMFMLYADCEIYDLP